MKVLRALVAFLAAWLHAWTIPVQAESVVVFNEIHYHPSPSSTFPEFIELLNQNATDVDLSGWSLDGAVQFTFPDRSFIRGGSTLLISSQPQLLAPLLPEGQVFGPYQGQLSNGGETLRLRSANLLTMDTVSYEDKSPWPEGADGTGYSLTKRGPNLNSESPSSWTLSSSPGGSPGRIEFAILPPNQILESKSALIAFYPFDSGPLDATKNRRHGTPSPSGAILTTNQGGFEGECYRFNGQGYIDLPIPLSPSIAPQITIGAWVRAASLSSPARNEIISTDNGSYDRALTIDTRSGLGDAGVSRYSAFGGATTGVIPGPIAKATDGWVFIAASFDSVFGRTTLYVQTNVYFGPATHGAAAPFTRVGAHPLGIEFFNGWIDNVFIFNRLLSREEIEIIRTTGAEGIREVAYRPTPPTEDPRRPLLTLLPLDQSANDLSGRGFHAVTNGAIQWSTPPVGFENGSLFCSGGGLTIPLNLGPNVKPRITFGAWVKPSRISTNSARHPILATGTRTFDRGISIDSRSGERESGTPRYVALGGDGIGTIPGRSASIQDDWTFCAAIYDTTQGSTTFIVDDQVQYAEASQFSDVSNLYVGRSASGTATFQGWIDNVFVFNRVLTLAEIQSIRTGGTRAILDLNAIPDSPTPPSRPAHSCPTGLLLNELDAAGHSPFRIECINRGPDPLNLSPYQIHVLTDSRTHKLPLPPSTLQPNEVFSLTLSDITSPIQRNDLIYIICAENLELIDARHVSDRPQSRLSTEPHPWTANLPPTQGAPNPPTPTPPPIGFNEIHYHPMLAPSEANQNVAQAQWIELWNRSNTTLDLTGWKIDGDVQFVFPPSSFAAPQSYIVIARDPADFRTRWPNQSCYGPFNGSLKRGKSSQLHLLTAESSLVDEVRYADSGRWPEAADGGGSSLELRDPRANHSSPESWAASLETSHSVWTSFSYQGIATQNPGYIIGNDQFQELVLGLLDTGEVLLDDLSVIETSSTNNVSLVQNGSFQSDRIGSIPASWRIGGNHDALGQTRVIQDPDQPTNQCLRLVATGPTDYLHNHLETTLRHGNQSVRIVPGRSYSISFRAKWISGTPLLNTRLYFNFLQKTHQLTTPSRSGTPGAQNSTYTPNLGPTLSPIQQDPPVPSPSDSISFETQVEDPDRIASVSLRYRINSNTWQSTPMSPLPNNRWKVELPRQPADTRIQFYVSAVDSLGAESSFPPQGSNSCAMLKVEANPPASSSVHRLLILMPPSEVDLLYNPLLRMSNQRRRATVIYDDTEVFHNVGIRLKGSAFGRNNDSETGLNIEFEPDHLFRGIHSSIALERSGGSAGREILAKYFFNQAGPEIGSLYDDIAHVRMPRSSDDGMALIALSRSSEDFLQNQWTRGNEGSVWNMDLLYSPNSTSTGQPEAPKLNFPYNHDFGQPDIQDLGNDKEFYRWNFTLRNNRAQDDYTALLKLAQAFEKKGDELDTATTDVMDVEQWLRHFAILSIVGNSDVYLRYWNHNIRLYQRPSDGRMLVLPWDLDSSFTLDINAPLWGTSNGLGTPLRWARVIDLPGNSRRFQAHILDLLTRKATPGRIAQWASHYGSLAQQDFSPHADWLIQRRRYLLAQLTRLTNFFQLNTSNGVVSTNPSWTLSGRAGIEVHHLRINGQPAQLQWSGPSRSATNFTCKFNLLPGSHSYVVEVYNLHHELLPSWTQTLILSYSPTNPPQPTTVIFNEWMAANSSTLRDPSDQDFDDWLELWNPSNTAIDLGGYALSDIPGSPRLYVIPSNSGYVIPPRGFFLVWADGETHQNKAGQSGLHLPFKLSSDGEILTLTDPLGQIIDSITFGPQIANISEGRFPDGAALRGPMSIPTPGTSNLRTASPRSFSLSNPQRGKDGTLSWSIPTELGVTYRLLSTSALPPSAWIDTGVTLVGDGTIRTLQIPPANSPSPQPFRQFYRVIAE